MELAAIKRLWISALRSGHYKQLREATESRAAVACCATYLLAIEYGKVVGQDPWLTYQHLFTGLKPVLPAELFGVVTGLNDTGVTFEEIADFLETQYDDNFNHIKKNLHQKLAALAS